MCSSPSAPSHVVDGNSDYMNALSLNSFLGFCDGVFDGNRFAGGAACMLFNQAHSLIDGVAKLVKASFPLVAEVAAIKEACCLFVTRGISSAFILSDSKQAISLASSYLDPPWDVAALILDIRKLAADFKLEFIHPPRAANCVAHWVIKALVNGSLPVNWVSMPPSPLEELLLVSQCRVCLGVICCFLCSKKEKNVK